MLMKIALFVSLLLQLLHEIALFWNKIPLELVLLNGIVYLVIQAMVNVYEEASMNPGLELDS